MSKSHHIYLDYAASTPVDSKVSKAMNKAEKYYANASSVHATGRTSAGVLQVARESVAKLLGVKSTELVFTASGSESNNLALFGIARALRKYGNHIIISSVEHASVQRACNILKKEGFVISKIPVDADGLVDLTAFEKLLNSKTILVSCILVQNEIGTVQPIKKISDLIKKHRHTAGSLFPLFHTDACQAPGVLSLQPHQLGVDALTLNGAKCYGPHGVALLWSNSRRMQSLIVGGEQEQGLRAGTENISGIVGLAEALKIADQIRSKEYLRFEKLKKKCIELIKQKIPNAKILAEQTKTVPHILAIALLNESSERIVQSLSTHGVSISSGSACTAHQSGASEVVQALHLSRAYREGVIRISFGRETREKQIHIFVKSLKSVLGSNENPLP